MTATYGCTNLRERLLSENRVLEASIFDKAVLCLAEQVQEDREIGMKTSEIRSLVVFFVSE